jgi:hypothetical protein
LSADDASPAAQEGQQEARAGGNASGSSMQGSPGAAGGAGAPAAQQAQAEGQQLSVLQAPSNAASASVSSSPAAGQQQRATQHQQHADSSSSSSSRLGAFGVTAAQLRQLVQAGVDDSQADGAAAVMRALVQRLQDKQARKRQRSAQRHAAEAGAAAPPAADVAAAPLAAAPSPASPASLLVQLPRALASALGTSLTAGASGAPGDAAARAAAFGANSLASAATSSFWALLLEAASDSTLLLLMAAGGLSLALAAGTGKEAVDFIDGGAILASVAICVAVTAVTNYQKEAKFRAINSLKENVPVRRWRAARARVWGGGGGGSAAMWGGGWCRTAFGVLAHRSMRLQQLTPACGATMASPPPLSPAFLPCPAAAPAGARDPWRAGGHPQLL